MHGQLAEARLNGVLQASYLYNAQGSRTRKSTSSGTTVYHYDLKGRLIAETQPDGTLLRAYVWTDEAPIAQIDRSILGQETVVYLHTDHQGTPRLATSQTGVVVWRWVGSAFGDVSPNEDPDNDGSLTTVNLRYDGQYFDSETGLHYNWMRYYDPRTGRYITSDPIGLAGGLNAYLYVAANPLRFIDPWGLLDVYGPVLSTNMTAGTTTFYPGLVYSVLNGIDPLTIPTSTKVDPSISRFDATTPFNSENVPLLFGGQSVTLIPQTNNPKSYGPSGTYIKTGSGRGLDIHGGGSCPASNYGNSQTPRQGWCPTAGCTRGQNEDVQSLYKLIQDFQRQNPDTYTPSVRY